MDKNVESPQIEMSLPTEAVKLGMGELQSMIQLSAIGMAVISANTNFIDVNQKLCTMLGYTEKELLNLSYSDIVPHHDLTTHEAENDTQIRKYYKKNGQIVWGRSSLRKVLNEQGAKLFIDQVYDVTKEMMLESACSSITDELKALSYSVSHDLRSPLRSIHGFSQALKEDNLDNLSEEGKNYLTRIYNASVRMGKMLDQLLELARLSTENFRVQKIDLTLLIKEAIKNFNVDSKYNFEIEEGLEINGDLKSIKILFENLIDNAIKFSSKTLAPSIQIGSITNEGLKTFYVKDNGAGFDQTYADKLFGAYQRLHTHEEFEGSGIGLAKAKRIVNKHGGKIWAEGEPNQGATFHFTLNLS